MEKMRLLNTYVNNITLDEAVEFLLQKIREQTPAYVVEVNVDVVVKMETDPVLRQITDNADLTLVDGQPLIWISKLYGRPLKMKVSGSDLVPTLLQAAAKEGRSVFVLGGKEDAARKAAENIKARYPDLVMAGALSPSMGFEKKPEEVAYIRETLQKVKPDILLACFGCPKQEKWVSEHYRDCAPKVFSENGLEWFYRFVKEPKRLFHRYFVDDMQIFRLAWKYRNAGPEHDSDVK